MTSVDVLAPLRLETRFLPAEAGGWLLRVRVYPDDFSLGRTPTPPTTAELDVLSDVLTAPHREEVAFRRAAGALGARRAWWLWRTATVPVVEGGTTRRIVDRAGEADPALLPAAPIGLPNTLEVWLHFTDGTRRLARTLHPNRAQIAFDLDPARLNETGERLPRLWWLDYQRACGVELATEFDLSEAEAHQLSVLVVVGGGTTPAAELVGAHLASGRLAALAQGTPTNTVHGEPTTDLGDDAGTWLGLLHGTAADQHLTRALLTAFGVAGAAMQGQPGMPGGGLDHDTPGRMAVRGLWPLLWGRMFRDVIGAGIVEPDLAIWARRWLAVQGTLPAIRVGEQPYGLLPTTLFARWQADPADDPALAAVEERIVAWATRWRRGAATHASQATTVPGHAPVVGAGPERMLEILGRHAPSRHWKVRPVLDLATLQATQVAHGVSGGRRPPPPPARRPAGGGRPPPPGPHGAPAPPPTTGPAAWPGEGSRDPGCRLRRPGPPGTCRALPRTRATIPGSWKNCSPCTRSRCTTSRTGTWAWSVG